MEGTNNKTIKHKNEEGEEKSGLLKKIDRNIMCHEFVWHENITEIDLTGRKIATLGDLVKLPKNLIHLNLSRNEFLKIPETILVLEKLVILNLSHNKIEFFDDRPGFCHTLEVLDISHNNLAGPPYWVWAEAPQKLSHLNLSDNSQITKSFVNGFFEELLQYNTLLTDVYIHNCRLGKYTELLVTFPKAKSLYLGVGDYTASNNSLIELPCPGLNKCSKVENLVACNTNIYVITPRIDLYKNLVKLDLALNELNGLPDEFCDLDNLEVCILSYNKLLYLPNDIYKLQKLHQLYLDGNVLCMIPDTLTKLLNLKTLDLYDNNLNEVPYFQNVEELDLAMNYFEEPNDITYLDRRKKLRLLHENRYNGRKDVIVNSEDEYSERSSIEEDNEELYEIFYNGKQMGDSPNPNPLSSPEDWDSDEYWVPCPQNKLPAVTSPWLYFVKRKMEEGNFCPIDLHTDSVVELIKSKRQNNPQIFYETDGQFDDFSSDET